MSDTDRELEVRLEKLYRRRQFGIKPGLDTVERMCRLLGDPQKAFGVIHVAGTNGKGSVCAITESILRAAGMSVGLYTSPHLVRFNERIRINGEDISDSELADALDVCETAAAELCKATGHEATFFEIATVLAFECFRRAGVSIAVLETGLGGRLDATNVVMPLLSVITPVAIEHTRWLGDSAAEIAREKAGIIKRGRPVISAGQPLPDAVDVICAVADDNGSPLIMADEAVSIRRISGDLNGQKIKIESASGLALTARLPLIGSHQLENAAVAVAAIETVFGLIGIEPRPGVIKSGLANVRWPGRCQLLRDEPPVIIDAAHNPAGAEMLVKVLRRHGIRRAAVVVGMCSDKDIAGVVGRLSGIVAAVWVVPLQNERGLPPAELACLTRSRGLRTTVADSVDSAVSEAGQWAAANSIPLLITGSLFLLGEILKKA